jgi:hypothetical protein
MSKSPRRFPPSTERERERRRPAIRVIGGNQVLAQIAAFVNRLMCRRIGGNSQQPIVALRLSVLGLLSLNSADQTRRHETEINGKDRAGGKNTFQHERAVSRLEGERIR